MTPLEPIDRELLDFLCACAHHRVRVIRVKSPRAASLRRLREAGLVGRDDHLPSGCALLDWIASQKTKSAAALHARAVEEPPQARAADRQGGGDARKVAPSPHARDVYDTIATIAFAFGDKAPKPPAKRSGPPSMAERARRFEGQRNTQGASGTPKKGPSASSSGDASRIEDRAPTQPSIQSPHGRVDLPAVAPAVDESAVAADEPNEPRPALGDVCRPVDRKGNARRDPTQAPDLPLTELRDRQVLSGHRHAAAVRRGREQSAAALVDAGVNPASQNSMVCAQMHAIVRRREEEARLADPVEQAKTIIRQRGWVCFAAVISGGPKDKFYIGNRLVTKAQLLAFAENLLTTRRARA